MMLQHRTTTQTTPPYGRVCVVRSQNTRMNEKNVCNETASKKMVSHLMMQLNVYCGVYRVLQQNQFLFLAQKHSMVRLDTAEVRLYEQDDKTLVSVPGVAKFEIFCKNCDLLCCQCGKEQLTEAWIECHSALKSCASALCLKLQ